MSDTPEQIAARLTKAQRGCIYPGPGNPECARGPVGSMRVLLSVGVVKDVNHWSFNGKRGGKLTPLGAAVRAVVAREDGDA